MGHALGFSHSPDSNSVMFAYDTPRKWTFTPMDKYNMQMYYGTKRSTGRTKKLEEERKEHEKSGKKEKEHETDDIKPDEV
uniref:Uncharacterized protein n=1 Tax=Caenorhabditis japonica TaxID=281687 RepID=A0A8R1ECM2_CAEJA